MSIVRTATLMPQLTSPDKTYGLAEASIYMYVDTYSPFISHQTTLGIIASHRITC
jgi:hypothetical protein